MKKEYIAPQLFAYEVALGQLLAGSGEITVNGKNATVEPGTGSYGGNDWASRRGGWDDDDDDDF